MRIVPAWPPASPAGWWSALAACVIVEVLVLAAGLWQVHAARGQAAQSAYALDALRAQPAPPAPPPASEDFTARLGPPAAESRVLATVAQAAQAAGVVLGSLTLQQHAPAADQLGRQDLTLALRGDYAACKQVLAELAGRFEGLTVRTLRLRKDAAAAAPAETSAVLTLWSAPLRPAPAAR